MCGYFVLERRKNVSFGVFEASWNPKLTEDGESSIADLSKVKISLSFWMIQEHLWHPKCFQLEAGVVYQVFKLVLASSKHLQFESESFKNEIELGS